MVLQRFLIAILFRALVSRGTIIPEGDRAGSAEREKAKQFVSKGIRATHIAKGISVKETVSRSDGSRTKI